MFGRFAQPMLRCCSRRHGEYPFVRLGLASGDCSICTDWHASHGEIWWRGAI